SAQGSASEDPVIEILARLWQTQVRSVELLEEWQRRATDRDVKAGLKLQINDERRHQRILSDEIRRRGGRFGAVVVDQVLNKPFAIVKTQSDDIARVAAYYGGIKRFTTVRCNRLVPMVDQALGHLLQQITQDEDRHLRWADIRLERTLTPVLRRQYEPMMHLIEQAMDAVWSKPLRRLSQSRIADMARIAK
ncbi:MAG TPA: hypothetical protein VFY10_10285, partial [Dehalococcoidia bacterium]|nr:hypothetical protein [Dehalococcoidia bacterium]